MNIIVAADAQWGIGYENQLLARIPADMRRFRDMTLGRTVVLGRKTLETFPGGRPLPERENIILSTKPAFAVEGAVVAASLRELWKLLEGRDPAEIFVIGGASLYRQLLPYCRRAFVTRIDHSYRADSFFPDLDGDGEWEQVARSEEQSCFDITYHFVEYARRSGHKPLPGLS